MTQRTSLGEHRLRADAVWREADGEIIAIDDGFKNYVSTNGTGTLLWRRLADGASPEALAALLVATYGIARTHAEHDVRVFLTALDAEGFLEPLPGRA